MNRKPENNWHHCVFGLIHNMDLSRYKFDILFFIAYNKNDSRWSLQASKNINWKKHWLQKNDWKQKYGFSAIKLSITLKKIH